MAQKFTNYISSKSSVDASAKFEAPVRLYGEAKVARKAEVGRFSYVNTRTTLHSGTKVGRYCSIGKNIEIGPFDHPMQRLSTSPVSYNMHLHFPKQDGFFQRAKLKRTLGTSIGNDVWIGSNVVIMRGITIGSGAVIGAGSIVTKDVAPYAIVVGSPAREIRKRFDDATIKRLLKTCWWDKPVEFVAQLNFDDLEACLAALEDYDQKASAALAPPSDTQAAPDAKTKPAPKASAQNSLSPEKSAVLDSLKLQIQSIPLDASKPLSEAREAFLDMLSQKMEAINAPQNLLDFVSENASKLYHAYDLNDPYDQVILNNKVLYVVGLTQDIDTAEKLPPKLGKSILATLSSKS